MRSQRKGFAFVLRKRENRKCLFESHFITCGTVSFWKFFRNAQTIMKRLRLNNSLSCGLTYIFYQGHYFLYSVSAFQFSNLLD